MIKNKILIIEDDPGLALTIADRLESEGYCPTVVHQGDEALVIVLCARQGAIAWECKSPTSLVRGIVSLRARVSVVRLNLKEATGKTLV